jgi:predicted DNA-binding transcriptional regulator YafY
LGGRPEPRRKAILTMLRGNTKLPLSAIESRLRHFGVEVTRRTLERDLLDLEAGGEIVSEGSRPRVYGRVVRSPLALRRLLDPAEATLMRMAEIHLHRLLPQSLDGVFSGLFKEARHSVAVDAGVAGDIVPAVARWPDKVVVLPEGLPRLAPHILPAVQAAVSEALLSGRRIEAVYWTRHRQSQAKVVLSPLALVHRGPSIYLVAATDKDPPVRSYAMQRLREATVLDEDAIVPKDFALQKWLDSGEMQFIPRGKIELILRVRREVRDTLEEAPLSTDQLITPLSSTWSSVRATVVWSGDLERWILSMGSWLIVESPQPLQEQIKRRVCEMAHAYGDRGG